MPKVGDKHFRYTAAGLKEAARYAKATKKRVRNKPVKKRQKKK